MGEVFAGRYELVDPIGRGGVGAVWRAWDQRRRRYVAAKVLQQRNAHTLLRFVREQALRIDHPHVLAPASWAADDDQVLFTMDLVTGGSLAHVIGDYGALPPRFCCTLLDQLLAGLAAVHAEGVVHRDIKPANILLEATGTGRPHLRLSDFGISMRKGEPRLTETDYVVGTPGYFAPEQMLGAEPDFTADLFAVGLVALYLLQGAKPDAKALIEHFAAHGTPGAPRGVPEPLWQVIATLLQPDPQARFRTAAGARKALASATEVLPEPGPDDELVEIFDQLGPLPEGFGPDGPLTPAPKPPPPQPPSSQQAASHHAAAQHAASHHTAAQHAAAQHSASQHAAAQHTTSQHAASPPSASQHAAPQLPSAQLPAGHQAPPHQPPDHPLGAQQSVSQPRTPPSVPRPPTGQPSVGQPAMAEPAAGQPAMPQPATGQPATGQPALGQPPVAHPPLPQLPMKEPSTPQRPATPPPPAPQPATSSAASTPPASPPLAPPPSLPPHPPMSETGSFHLPPPTQAPPQPAQPPTPPAHTPLPSEPAHAASPRPAAPAEGDLSQVTGSSVQPAYAYAPTSPYTAHPPQVPHPSTPIPGPLAPVEALLSPGRLGSAEAPQEEQPSRPRAARSRPARSHAARPQRGGPPVKVALPMLLAALACFAVGFWALFRI
ncbi:serine/threonine-protein kinase [Streptomyces sp. MNP-20]|uniref:serine/threonine-protein kinase n=1 Tax=Streptomyces sp. MNP-20 TaxID=2721165 RepID=UPI00155390A1|nr:serine/threonine-protein kinase [Streptomyces sp. MNP-20]